MSENESIKSYDVPTTEGVTPVGAKQVLSKMDADILGDPLHPVSNRQHPQSREFKVARAKLFEIQADPRTPLAKAMDDAMSNREDKEAKKQAERIEQAQDEVAKIAKLGYAKETVPDDISVNQLNVLVMRRLCAEGDYNNVMPRITKALRGLKPPQGVNELVKTLCFSSDHDPSLRQEVTLKIISWIDERLKRKEGIVC